MSCENVMNVALLYNLCLRLVNGNIKKNKLWNQFGKVPRSSWFGFKLGNWNCLGFNCMCDSLIIIIKYNINKKIKIIKNKNKKRHVIVPLDRK